jgi:hypothetical protein
MQLPRWLYWTLAALAIVVAAGKPTLVGNVAWLPHGGDGEHYVDFAELALVLAGFGSFMKKVQP